MVIIVAAPPKAVKTSLLKENSHKNKPCLQNNHPEAELIVLLIDERPEEVTDIETFC